jgi:hypothetical protein
MRRDRRARAGSAAKTHHPRERRCTRYRRSRARTNSSKRQSGLRSREGPRSEDSPTTRRHWSRSLRSGWFQRRPRPHEETVRPPPSAYRLPKLRRRRTSLANRPRSLATSGGTGRPSGRERCPGRGRARRPSRSYRDGTPARPCDRRTCRAGRCRRTPTSRMGSGQRQHTTYALPLGATLPSGSGSTVTTHVPGVSTGATETCDGLAGRMYGTHPEPSSYSS